MDLSVKVQDSASHGGLVGIAALTIWLLIGFLKSDAPLAKSIPLPPRARPLLAVALGQTYAVLEAVLGGIPWGAAIVRGLLASAGAIGFQEVLHGGKGGEPPAAGGAGGTQNDTLRPPPLEQDLRIMRAWLAKLELALLAFTPRWRLPTRARFALLSLGLLLSGCQHNSRAQVASDIDRGLAAAKPLCKLAAEQLEADWLTFVCEAASSVIPGIVRGMSTDDTLDPSRRTSPIRVRVETKRAAAFELCAAEAETRAAFDACTEMGEVE